MLSETVRVPYRDRESWLAERRKYVTATDVGRLANGGVSVFAAVKAEKLGTAPPFNGNVYTRWGVEREPHLVAHLGFLYNIEPNRDLFVRGNYAATPDGVGDGLIAEVKTTIQGWEDVDDLRAHRPQYYDQVIWAQHVLGVNRTVFAFEVHENFIPTPVEHFIIEHDEERLAVLLQVADTFITNLDASEPEGEWDEFMARYSIAEQALLEAQTNIDGLKAEFRERAGGRELAAKTPFGSISYQTPKPRTTFDVTGFRKAHKDLAEEYTRLVPPNAPVLRITTK